MQQKRPAKMAREARHSVDEAFFAIFGKYLTECSKMLLNFVRQPKNKRLRHHVEAKHWLKHNLSIFSKYFGK